MKHRMICGLAGACGTMIACSEAQASYLKLGVRLHTTVTLNGTARDVWRVYAVFDNPGDILTAIGGSVANGSATIKTLTSSGSAGANFFNAGGSTAPMQSAIDSNPNAEWDTFATIGVAINDGFDQTGVSPGFPSFISGNQWGPTNSAWFIPGGQPQGKAGNGINDTFWGGGFFSGMGVLIAQLTVNKGQGVVGTLFVNCVPAKGGGSFTATGQTFDFPIGPAPGAMVMMGLAGLVGGRRRRTGPQISQMTQR